MERLSSTPASAGPVNILFTLWHPAQREVKTSLPSSQWQGSFIIN
jgi:hypothetical protein